MKGTADEETKDGNKKPRNNQRQKKQPEEKADATPDAPEDSNLTPEERQKLEEQKKKEKAQKQKEYLDSLPKQYKPFVATKTQFDSKYREYMFGEWRRRKGFPQVHVTKETIVPDKPKKILTEPDDVAYHMKVAQIDEKIEVLKAEIKEINADMVQERSDMIDGQ